MSPVFGTRSSVSRTLTFSLTSPPFDSVKHSRHSCYLARSIEHPAKSHLHNVEEAACRRTERAFKLRAVIGGWKKKMEKSDAIPPERNNVRGEGREGARNERGTRRRETRTTRGGGRGRKRDSGWENRRLSPDRVFRRHYRFIFYAGFTIGCVCF